MKFLKILLVTAFLIILLSSNTIAGKWVIGSYGVVNPENPEEVYLFVNESTGFVGIGTNAPSYSLDVIGSGRITQDLYVEGYSYLNKLGRNLVVGTYDLIFSPSSIQLYSVDNAVGLIDTDLSPNRIWFYDKANGELQVRAVDLVLYDARKIRWSDVNIYRGGANLLKTDDSFETAGNLYVSGNVGIGTTSPQAKLDVNGGGYIRGTLNMTQNKIVEVHTLTLRRNTANNLWQIYGDLSDNFQIYSTSLGANVFTISPTGSVSIREGLTVDGGTLYVDAANNKAGIGTTSPGAKLHVYGTSTDVIVGDAGSGYSVIRLLGSYSDDYAYIQAGTSSTDTTAKLRISRYTTATSPLADLQIYSDKTYFSGDVGIGTTSPSEKLEITGNIKLNPGANPAIIFSEDGTQKAKLQRIDSDTAIKLINSGGYPIALKIDSGDFDMNYNNIKNLNEINSLSLYAVAHSYATDDAASPKVWLSDQGNIIIMSYEDNNAIFVNGNYQTTLNAGQSIQLSLSAGDMITATKPFSTASTGSAVAVAVPISWAGYRFAYYVDRGDPQHIWIYAPFSRANVKVYNGTTLITTLSIAKGSSTYYSNNFVGNTLILESDAPIIVWKRATTEDGIPLYPCSKELYGVASGEGYVSALEDSTEVTIYFSDGASTTISLNRGQSARFDAGSQYAGPASRIVANKPVCARAEGDGDGCEQTVFTNQRQHATNFVLPANAEFIALVSYRPAKVRVYNSTHTVCEASLSGTNGVYFVKLTSSDCGLKAGYRIITDNPVWAIFEYGTSDETMLQGYTPTTQFGLSSVKGAWGSTGDFYVANNLKVSETATVGDLSCSNCIALGSETSGTLPLSEGGTGASLSDPNDDRILFWDDSASTVTWLDIGSGLTLSGTTISHADTSSQGSVDNSDGTVIQDVSLDDYGHVTGLVSYNLDNRYYTESEADSRFVNTAGDTMSGDLTIYKDLPALNLNDNSDSGIDVTLRANNENLEIVEPEDSSKVWAYFEDDKGLHLTGAPHLYMESGNIYMYDHSVYNAKNIETNTIYDPDDAYLSIADHVYFTVNGTRLYLKSYSGQTYAGIYTSSTSNRLFVRAENTDNVAQFASYGLYLPRDVDTGLFVTGGARINYGGSEFVVDNSGNVKADGGTFYVDAANNRVGIGTTSPGYKLDVRGGAIFYSDANDQDFIVKDADKGSVSNVIWYDYSEGQVLLGNKGANNWEVRVRGSLDVDENVNIDSNLYMTDGTIYDADNVETNTIYDPEDSIIEIKDTALIYDTATGDQYDYDVRIGGDSSNALYIDTAEGAGLVNLVAGAYWNGTHYLYGGSRGASRIELHDGVINLYVGGTSGSAGSVVSFTNVMSMDNSIVRSYKEFRAPEFVDSDNTDYYLDPHSTSYLYRLGIVNEIYSNGDIRIDLDENDDGTNYFRIYNGGDSQIFYVSEGGLVYASGDGNFNNVKLRGQILYSDANIYLDLDNNDDGTNYLYVRDGGNNVVMQVDESGNLQVKGNIYDLDDGDVNIGENLVVSGDITVNGYDLDLVRGDYGYIHSVGRISFDWTSGTYDNPDNHGITSKNEGGSWSDDLRINSYGDIINTIDSNNNDATSYFKVQHHSTGDGEDLFWVRSADGDAYFKGNVGIGTTSPYSRLHVYREGEPNSTVGSAPASIRIEGGGNYNWAAGEAASELLFMKDGDIVAAIRAEHDRPGGEHSYEDAGLTFYTGSVAETPTLTPALHICSGHCDYNVGIGTTSPADKLDVNGDIRVRGNDIKDSAGTSRISFDTSNKNVIITIG